MIAIGALVLLATGPAAAVDFSLQIYADGVRIDDGNVDQTRLGCVDNPDGVTALCNAEGLNYGGTYTAVEIDIIDFFIDPDPIVTGTLGVTNTGSTATTFTFIFTLPVSSMPNTVTGGRISGTLTDQGGGGATVSAPAGSSFYTALLDGAPYGGGATTLYDDPTSFSALNNSTIIPQLQFGAPIPSFPGPAVTTSIGIQLHFTLTGFDQVSFTSNHVVVPEPGTAALLGLGLAFLARRRRG